MADASLAQTLLTETEVSKQLRVSLAALRKWRVINRGPQFLKIGSLVRYRQGDLHQWLASLPVGGELHQTTTPADTSLGGGTRESALRDEDRVSHFMRTTARV